MTAYNTICESKSKSKILRVLPITSNEEIGNDIYYPMKDELRRQCIPFTRRRAKRLAQDDYEQADLIFYRLPY